MQKLARWPAGERNAQYPGAGFAFTGMRATPAPPSPAAAARADGLAGAAFRQVGPRLRHWLRRQLPQGADAEDLLQDVFQEFVVAQRAMQPIADAAAWLFHVARHRLIDRSRRRRLDAEPVPVHAGDDGPALEDLLPDPADGPEALYARQVLLAEMEQALAALPPAQREVFIAHELEGRSFAQMAAETGVPQNTLLARKHSAVRALRARLQATYDDWLTD